MAPPKHDPNQNTSELAGLVKEIAVKTVKTAADVEDLKKGQAQVIATQLQHGMLLTGHDTTLKRLEAVQTEHGTLLASHDTTLKRLEAVQTEHGTLLASHGTLLASHDTTLKRLEAVQTEHGVRLDRVERKVDQVIDVMNDNFGRLFAMLKKE